MFIGQTIVAENYDDNEGGGLQAFATDVFTPWFPREGDAATFYLEILSIAASYSGGNSTPTVRLEVHTKNSEDADAPGSQSVANSSASTTGLVSARASSLKELVRLKFRLSDLGSSISARTFQAVIRPLQPAWETN